MKVNRKKIIYFFIKMGFMFKEFNIIIFKIITNNFVNFNLQTEEKYFSLLPTFFFS